jgi:hypothetical protein
MSLGRVSEFIYKTPPDKSAAISGGLTERQSQTARLRHRERRSSRLKRIFFEVPNEMRTHRSLNKDAPVFRTVQRIRVVKSHAILGGLHHHYVRI